MGDPSSYGEHELVDSQEELSSEELVGQIGVNRLIPTSNINTSHISGPVPSMSQIQCETGEFDALIQSDLLEDTKFYQDAVVEYQSNY